MIAAEEVEEGGDDGALHGDRGDGGVVEHAEGLEEELHDGELGVAVHVVEA